jgi:hypothetical protein
MTHNPELRCTQLGAKKSSYRSARVPDGQIAESHVQPPREKYFGSLLTQITCTSLAIPAHTKGRFAIVTDEGQGMRWTWHVKDE